MGSIANLSQTYPGGGLGLAATGLSAGSDIAGLINSFLAAQQRSRVQNLLTNPAAFARYVQGLYAPMTAAESTAVSRDVASDLAARGLTGGQFPKQMIADALAKIESSRYRNATSTALSALTGSNVMPTVGTPLGATGSTLQNLLILRALRGGPESPGLVRGDAGGLTLSDTLRSASSSDLGLNP